MYLARWLAYTVFPEMPLWMYDTIRFVLDLTGNADVRDPDDISVLSLMSTAIASWIVTAFIVIVLYKITLKLIDRCRRMRDTKH